MKFMDNMKIHKDFHVACKIVVTILHAIPYEPDPSFPLGKVRNRIHMGDTNLEDLCHVVQNPFRGFWTTQNWHVNFGISPIFEIKNWLYIYSFLTKLKFEGRFRPSRPHFGPWNRPLWPKIGWNRWSGTLQNRPLAKLVWPESGNQHFRTRSWFSSNHFWPPEPRIWPLGHFGPQIWPFKGHYEPRFWPSRPLFDPVLDPKWPQFYPLFWPPLGGQT